MIDPFIERRADLKLPPQKMERELSQLRIIIMGMHCVGELLTSGRITLPSIIDAKNVETVTRKKLKSNRN